MSDVTFAVSEAAFKAVFNRQFPSKALAFGGSTTETPLWLDLGVCRE